MIKTNQKPCGCYTEQTDPESDMLILLKHLCPEHEAKIALADREEKNNKYKAARGDAEELLCGRCHGHIGYVDSFDLQGSYFLCDTCFLSED